MVKRRCRICDGEVTGSFCPVCKQFVQTYTVKQNYYLNERHPDYLEGDKGCEYHKPLKGYADPEVFEGRTTEEFEMPDYTPKPLESKPFAASEEVYGRKADTGKSRKIVGIVIGFVVAFYIFSCCCGMLPVFFS